MFLKKKIPIRRSILIGLVIALVACKTDTTYHSYHHVSSIGWSKSDTLLFSVPIVDSIPVYKILVDVRNDESYSCQDIFLFIKRTNTVDSTLYVTDTLRCVLSDGKGKWRGLGLGALYQSEHFYVAVSYPHKGMQNIRISHGMTDDLLHGITDIGIRVEKQ